jgi:hypothetical protein
MILLEPSGFMNFIPSGFLPWLLTLTGTALIGLSGWIIKRYISAGSKKWDSLCAGIDALNVKVELQNTNHLEHIEKATGQTVEILLDMRRDQAEMVGYLKGMNDACRTQ